MKKEKLFEVFCQMFPTHAERAVRYKKIGSRTLAITFKRFVDDQKEEEYSRVFLYKSPDNWHFGTKLWRKRPKRLEKK